jgi:hypothetical protein
MVSRPSGHLAGADVALPSTEFAHNTDLDPSEEYLTALSRLRLVLRNPTLLSEFDRYDRVANDGQSRFRLKGMFSLWLAGVSLVGVTAELLLAALAVPVPPAVTAVFELCALGAIALALFGRTRTRWLAARFMTEQIRQWHFQMLLDGSLVSKAHVAPVDFENERAHRWARFMTQAPNAEGAMNSFVEAENLVLHHPVEPYSDEAVAHECFRAYVDLRFQKQLTYFKFKREYFAVRDEWSESLARWTLFSAVLLAAAQLFLTLIGKTRIPVPASDALFAAAIVLVILSTTLRVYRGALAVSPQRERYETKWVRLVTLRSAYDMAATAEGKLAIMKDVEIVEIEELREFLRQMRRASYLL